MQRVRGFEIQAEPQVLFAVLPGKWLLAHCRPSLRSEDPDEGFQRIVNVRRSEQMAIGILRQRKIFPNAIVLATQDPIDLVDDCAVELPEESSFLVIDGQHRLYAQKYSDHDVPYACILHLGLTSTEMARLFIEINDNQKRVPSSLRWDLVRLVRPQEREHDVVSSELVYSLAVNPQSPLFQRIDLTGENPELKLKQASIAPEVRSLISKKTSPLREMNFEDQFEVLATYLTAIKSLDPVAWDNWSSPFIKARILRALLQLLPLVAAAVGPVKVTQISAMDYRKLLLKLDASQLAPDKIRAMQGSAGIAAIRMALAQQLGIDEST